MSWSMCLTTGYKSGCLHRRQTKRISLERRTMEEMMGLLNNGLMVYIIEIFVFFFFSRTCRGSNRHGRWSPRRQQQHGPYGESDEIYDADWESGRAVDNDIDNSGADRCVQRDVPSTAEQHFAASSAHFLLSSLHPPADSADHWGDDAETLQQQIQ